MIHYYARIPAAAVYHMFDGNLYANVMYEVKGRCVVSSAEYRMMRYIEPDSFIKNGEAYVLIAKRGDKVPLHLPLPFGVSAIQYAD